MQKDATNESTAWRKARLRNGNPRRANGWGADYPRHLPRSRAHRTLVQGILAPTNAYTNISVYRFTTTNPGRMRFFVVLMGGGWSNYHTTPLPAHRRDPHIQSIIHLLITKNALAIMLRAC